MKSPAPSERVFLFLQGPHGPFFHRLGRMLSRAGADVWRVGFNMGDRIFWPGRHNFIAYRDAPEAWGSALEQILDEKSVTDIVLYGDTRPIHATAVEAAKTRGLRIHVFEEGYMRPYWVTYERGGANGHSRLMDLQVETMRRNLENSDMDTALPPASWGDMRQHIFYGALYHGFVLLMNRGYRGFRPHRSITVRKEFALYLQRLVLMPVQAVDRRIATWRIRHGGFPYHLALLQLEHDSSFQMHSPFASMTEFLETVIDGFAKRAPQHHHLVVKAHPLEDGRVPVRRELKRLAHARAALRPAKPRRPRPRRADRLPALLRSCHQTPLPARSRHRAPCKRHKPTRRHRQPRPVKTPRPVCVLRPPVALTRSFSS